MKGKERTWTGVEKMNPRRFWRLRPGMIMHISSIPTIPPIGVVALLGAVTWPTSPPSNELFWLPTVLFWSPCAFFVEYCALFWSPSMCASLCATLCVKPAQTSHWSAWKIMNPRMMRMVGTPKMSDIKKELRHLGTQTETATFASYCVCIFENNGK